MAVHAPSAPVPVPAPASPSHSTRDDHHAENGGWVSPSAARASSPPRINPQYLLHHGGSDELFPPLPPHLQRLATGEANSDDEEDSDTSDEDSDADSDDDFQSVRARSHSPPGPQFASTLSHSPPPQRSPSPSANNDNGPRRIIKKVSQVFRRGDDAARSSSPPPPVPPLPKTAAARLAPNLNMSPQRRSPVMQGPPPSPPLSDVGGDDVGTDYAPSIAVTEGTIDLPPPNPHYEARPGTPERATASLMPVTEAGESKHALVDTPPPSAFHASGLPDSGMAGVEEANRELKDVAQATPGGSSLRATSRERPPSAPYLGVTSQRRVSNGSTSSRAGSLSMVRSGRLAPQRDMSPSPSPAPMSMPVPMPTGALMVSPAVIPPASSPELRAQRRALPAIETSDDHLRRAPPTDTVFSAGVLSESPTSSSPGSARPGMQRRNTNPTTASPSPLSGRPLTHSVSISGHGPSSSIGKYDDFNLAPDILAQADVIRRERLERRQKKMSLLVTSPLPTPAPELPQPAPSASTPVEVKTAVKRRETEETKVLVGNLVGEGHRNYVLMYNMLTGIRVAVSRCQAKIRRPLTAEDYLARHKYSFDMLGNELTPSAKYDFKFKDYAPWVFRELRDDHFHLDPADYLLSLTAKYILSEIGSPGKSGSFFYYSRDYRFIIKTISHREHNFLRSILKDYHEHVRANPHTLLSRFYGLHRVKMPRGRKIHFVIMNNLFPPHRDIHETYDLKGSAFGREYPEDKAKMNPRAVLKDINWVNRGRTFEFGPEKRALFTEQLRRDMEFLRRINVMDYSLLVGIHNMERGNRDNLRLTKLRVFNPDTSKSAVVNRKPSAVKSHAEAHSVRRAVTRSDPKSMLDASVNMRLPEEGAPDRRHFIFYQDEGGMQATDEQNMPMDIIYYLGIIDICTPYNFGKRVEHAWKSVTENPVTISCVQPDVYGQRFFDFLQSVMRGGDVKLRPQGLEPPPECAGSPVGAMNPPACAPASFGRDPTVIAQRHDSEAHAIAIQTSPTISSRPALFDNAVVNPETHPVVSDEKALSEKEAMLGPVTAPPANYGTVDEKVAEMDAYGRDMNGHGPPAMVGHLKAE
ncbi:SAICAR synthase-like protein [Cutaneotrichosporon oleaginosum]|uniref:1-phosphatidylinositol-4-phosphate 5-kinase n=1 Tax=Cutaneotrichosporon oleaginosum TaxID=879819 RepID=A0A0J1B1X8_9TREE|nr:SAICAR synthase-like protein [Cutaneotrichosporon oleaginosum]KLT41624.1 SAICAR synthase-like protein [Cutaneotrichosporon oleaginosum]TXT08138.1 hypothetical protein COLE_05062 [Cutaneotrichosporon oleaginosum]